MHQDIGGVGPRPIVMSDRIKDICDSLIRMFESGQFPEAMARTIIMRQAGADRPCDRWSINNQILMLLAGTTDARGFNQWKAVKRYVKKGAKSFYILAPVIATVKNVDEDEAKVIGFRAVPVFRMEDTDGEPLPALAYGPPQLPPLHEVAERLGSVVYGPGGSKGELGSCTLNGNIQLHSYDPDVFFHELAHQVHNTITPLRPGQHADQEIVAEMCACVLCEIYGYSGYHQLGWKYIQAYANQSPETALRAINAVINDVEAVLRQILSSS